MGLCGVWLSEIENIGLLCIKVPYFWGKSTDVLPREVRCFCFPEWADGMDRP